MVLNGNIELVAYKGNAVLLCGLHTDLDLLPLDTAAGSEFWSLDDGK